MSYISKFKDKTYNSFLTFLAFMVDSEPTVDEKELIFTRKISLVDPDEARSRLAGGITRGRQESSIQAGIEIGRQIAAIESFLELMKKDAKRVGSKVSKESDPELLAEWEEVHANITDNLEFIKQKLNTGNLDSKLAKRLLLANLKSLKGWHKRLKQGNCNLKTMVERYRSIIQIIDEVAPKVNSYWNAVLHSH